MTKASTWRCRPAAPKRAEDVDVEDAGFILGSYFVTFATIAFVAWRFVRHGRRLSEQVPDDDKQWL